MSASIANMIIKINNVIINVIGLLEMVGLGYREARIKKGC
jgi:hypothetical protein